MSVVTLITVQNTLGVTQVYPLAPELVLAQLQAVLADLKPAALKTGALGDDGLIEALAADAPRWQVPLILDPVLFSKNGTRLTHANPRPLFPFATLITPNLSEASALTGCAVNTLADMQDAAQALGQQGARSVLVKGGHLPGDESVDLLWHEGRFTNFPAPRVATPHTHGTGCTFSAAITALLACGLPLMSAVDRAKAYITQAIRTNPGIGQGHGPVNHWA